MQHLSISVVWLSASGGEIALSAGKTGIVVVGAHDSMGRTLHTASTSLDTTKGLVAP